MGKLDGKVAWVTGAGSGIGEATAMTLAREGARVVLTGRRKEPLQSVAQRIGGAARVEQGDVTDAARVQAIADAIKAAHGRLDILVSNAGLNVTKRDWPDITPAAANEVIQANLNSAFYCTIAALPLMRAQQDGVLIHTSSMAGRYVSLLSGAA
ncbi:MAG TPA: SDR family NAD(P)-dependent oxidoreductase, partial [Acetobacteraceae bacterium]|nr:SDR family NAD(P)-dependent oxidoreductase [Acetobacteraceae bacterium]